MKKKLEVNSPEFRDLVGKLTTTKLTLPSLGTLPPLPKIPMSSTPTPMSSTPTPKSSISATAKSPISTKSPIVKKDVTFTGVKDVDLLILMQLDDKSLFRTCKVNKYVNELCKNEDFWRNRFQNKFGKSAKPEDKTWRNYYIDAIEEEKGINLYWTKGELGTRYNKPNEGGFYLQKKSNKEKHDDVLVVPNVYIKNIREPFFGIYEVKTKKLVSPLFNSESTLKKYRTQQPQEFRQRIDLATFKIYRPLYVTDLTYPKGERGNFNLPSVK